MPQSPRHEIVPLLTTHYSPILPHESGQLVTLPLRLHEDDHLSVVLHKHLSQQTDKLLLLFPVLANVDNLEDVMVGTERCGSDVDVDVLELLLVGLT